MYVTFSPGNLQDLFVKFMMMCYGLYVFYSSVWVLQFWEVFLNYLFDDLFLLFSHPEIPIIQTLDHLYPFLNF